MHGEDGGSPQSVVQVSNSCCFLKHWINVQFFKFLFIRSPFQERLVFGDGGCVGSHWVQTGDGRWLRDSQSDPLTSGRSTINHWPGRLDHTSAQPSASQVRL